MKISIIRQLAALCITSHHLESRMPLQKQLCTSFSPQSRALMVRKCINWEVKKCFFRHVKEHLSPFETGLRAVSSLELVLPTEAAKSAHFIDQHCHGWANIQNLLRHDAISKCIWVFCQL